MTQGFRNRYPTYNVLDKWDTPSWNDQTRAVVKKRLEGVPSRRFFREDEWEILEAVCDRLIPQPDRPGDKVPIAPFIDERLHENKGKGYRFENMPPTREAWRIGIRAIEEEARARWQRGFRELSDDLKDALLRAVQHGDTLSDAWQGMPPKRFFTSALLHEVVSVYYAHPAAWSEIGFGGPASPRGYVRMQANRRDPWEAIEDYER
ncbi:MAG: gluconate 2-dehydrogenase subunit 3 family protein [Alphaproteobacteria bacterium]